MLDQINAYAPEPPVAVMVALPSATPLHVTFELTVDDTINSGVCVIVTELELVVLFASVTVTVYVPATTPVIDAVVAALDQAYVNGAVPFVADAVAPPFEPP
jgi:hypothetical protein